MKIKILKPCIVDNLSRAVGDIVEVKPKDSRTLLAAGFAEVATQQPKKDKKGE